MMMFMSPLRGLLVSAGDFVLGRCPKLLNVALSGLMVLSCCFPRLIIFIDQLSFG
jgi:hypothetical protein